MRRKWNFLIADLAVSRKEKSKNALSMMHLNIPPSITPFPRDEDLLVPLRPARDRMSVSSTIFEDNY